MVGRFFLSRLAHEDVVTTYMLKLPGTFFRKSYCKGKERERPNHQVLFDHPVLQATS